MHRHGHAWAHMPCYDVRACAIRTASTVDLWWIMASHSCAMIGCTSSLDCPAPGVGVGGGQGTRAISCVTRSAIMHPAICREPAQGGSSTRVPVQLRSLQLDRSSGPQSLPVLFAGRCPKPPQRLPCAGSVCKAPRAADHLQDLRAHCGSPPPPTTTEASWCSGCRARGVPTASCRRHTPFVWMRSTMMTCR